MKNKKVDNIELVKVENLLEITKDITIEDETFKKLMFIYNKKPMNLANKQADSLVFLCFMKSIIKPRNND